MNLEAMHSIVSDAEYNCDGNKDQALGYLASTIIDLQLQVQAYRITKVRVAQSHDARIAKGNIDGLCQKLADEMSWWADNEAQTEDARDEICDTIRHLLKQIEAVTLTEPEPDDGSDAAYEYQRDIEMGCA
ncbi:MAG TPA: hypothetical protein VN372_05300 [Methanospirillum sp.]|nr:hypothetical protein [Methanospirillum sp.]